MSGDKSGAGFMVMIWIWSSHHSGKANHVQIQKRQGRWGQALRWCLLFSLTMKNFFISSIL